MATYEVELNGTTYEIDAPNEEAAAFAAAEIGKTAPPKTNGLPKGDPGKPKGALEHGVRMVDGFARGAADFLSFGFADEASAAVNALPALMTGGGPDAWDRAYRRLLTEEHTRDAADKRDVPVSRGVGQATGLVGTMAGGAVLNAGRLVPRLAPRATGLLRQGETLARNIAAGAGAGAAGGAGAADPGGRAAGAQSGAVVGSLLGAAAPAVGMVAGTGMRAVSQMGASAGAMTRRGASAFARQMGDQINPAAMRARRAEILANGGANPTLLDVAPRSAVGVVRAGATRNTPAYEAAQNFAEQRSLGLPDRVSTQARRNLSADPRTPDRIRADTTEARRVQGDADFAAVRDARVPLDQPSVETLRTGPGREAIRAAARTVGLSTDPADRAIMAELNQLADGVLDQPGQVQITVGMAQRISEALYDAADNAGRGTYAAGALTRLADSIRTNARNLVGGYDDALNNYAANSRLTEAAGVGEEFLRRNTDEFVDAASGMGPEENALARAAARRATERASGEGSAGAFSAAGKFATPEQQARTRALLPENEAQSLERGMATELEMARRGAKIAPEWGSKTQPAQEFAQRAAGAANVAQAVGSGNPASVLTTVLNWMKSGGLSDRDSQALVELAIDPNRIDDAIRLLEARGVALGDARGIVEGVRTALARSGGEAVQPTPEVNVTGETNPEYLDWLAQQSR